MRDIREELPVDWLVESSGLSVGIHFQLQCRVCGLTSVEVGTEDCRGDFRGEDNPPELFRHLHGLRWHTRLHSMLTAPLRREVVGAPLHSLGSPGRPGSGSPGEPRGAHSTHHASATQVSVEPPVTPRWRQLGYLKLRGCRSWLWSGLSIAALISSLSFNSKLAAPSGKPIPSHPGVIPARITTTCW